MILDIKPMSVNTAWKGKKYKTKDYSDYENHMLWLLKSYKECKPQKYYGIVISWHSKDAMRSDLDNIIKPFMDCLVKSEIVKDDRYCMEIHIEKIKSNKDYIDFKVYSLNEKFSTSLNLDILNT